MLVISGIYIWLVVYVIYNVCYFGDIYGWLFRGYTILVTPGIYTVGYVRVM